MLIKKHIFIGNYYSEIIGLFRNQIKTVFHNLFKQNHHEMLEMSDAEKYFIIWHHIEICKKRSIFGDDELHYPYHCTLMGQVT